MGVHPEPSPDCPVGKNIETILRKSYAEIENSVKTAMNNITLQHLLDQYNTFQY